MNQLSKYITRNRGNVLLLLLLLNLQGCAGLIVGAAGGAALAIHDRRDTETILKDEKIESIATDKIYSDAKLKTKIHTNITSYNQVVLVTGEVLTSDLRDHAIELIQQTPNIKRIHNELVVADLTSFSSRSADSIITSKVKAKMIGAKGLDATRVKVVTENGKVFLMGLVTDKEAEIAVDIARNVDKVKQVVKIFEIIPEPVATTAPAPVVDKK
ncbi:BON domain-containing protein [Kaarinaea lacus]